MMDLFAVEMRTLALHLSLIAERYRHSRDLSPEELSQALMEVTASLPVYRTYTRDFRIGSRDRAYIEDAVQNARKRNREIVAATFDFVRTVLLLDLENDEDTLRFVMRWQQLTGPIMAKGVEDTTLYVYNRLISMNDVGGSPSPVGLDRFHDFNIEREFPIIFLRVNFLNIMAEGTQGGGHLGAGAQRDFTFGAGSAEHHCNF